MKPTRSIYAGLFCLSAAVLLLEITLTRIFSVLLWGHYGFLVISTALLGFGAAGSYLAVGTPPRPGPESRRFLRRCCLLFALTLVAGVMVCSRLGYEPARTFDSVYHTLMLPTMYLVMVVPFFFAGLAIGYLLSSFARDISAIYFADLLGAGVGALAATLLLSNLAAPAALVGAGLLALVSGWLFQGDERRWTSYAWPAAFALLLAVVAVLDPWTIPVPSDKGLHQHRDEIEDSRWSLLARIDVVEGARRPLDFGSGTHRSFYRPRVHYRPFFMDGSNPSRMIRYEQDLWFVPKLLSATPYALGIERPEVLVIGSGGGIDTLVALESGAARVTAVEINPRTVELVTGDYADYIGRLFERPEVRLLAREGRHHLTLEDSRYDVIRLTGVDTAAASAIGANAQDHAYLYTVEAVRELYGQLSERGVLAVNRRQGWKHLRLLSVILTGLEELEVAQPARHLAVVTNGRWSDVLVRKRPFSRQDVRALRSWARAARMRVSYQPFEPGGEDGRFIRLPPAERARVARESPFDLAPVTDDSPFFFEPRRLEDVAAGILGLAQGARYELTESGYPTLLLALSAAFVLSALFILLPLIARRGRGASHPGRAASLTYFCLLGLGFILAELVFIQKFMIFLGGPIYSLSVTLFSILVFSGLGAYASRRIDPDSRRARLAVVLAVALLLLLTNFFLRWFLTDLLGLGFALRVLLGIACLAPASFLMGMPFPIGIRILERARSGLIAWAWGCNACLTVIGSVLSVILSMRWGFFATMMVAVVCYLLAALCLPRMASLGSTDEPAVAA